MSPEFVFDLYWHAFGIEIPEHLHMRAPKGATVLDPKLSRSHLGEMARRFPDARYAYHPELSRPNPTALGAWFYQGMPSTPLAGVVSLAVPAVFMASATAAYPTVAGPQYQSAISGQVGIGSSSLNIQPASSWKQLFSWSYWSS
jgi:hypothetical protein